MLQTHCRTPGRKRSVQALTVAAVALAPPAMAADPLAEALIDGPVTLDARYHYELVDQDSFWEEARASTVRTRLGYPTGDVLGSSGFIEAEDVTAVDPGTFNSTINGNDSRPKPVMEELTALYTLEYAHQSDYDNNDRSFDLDYYRVVLGGRSGGFTLKVSREMLGLDDSMRAPRHR